VFLGDRKTGNPNDPAGGHEYGKGVADCERYTFRPQHLLELLRARRAQRPVTVARPAVPDNEGKLEPTLI
jgi:hypothetical protein